MIGYLNGTIISCHKNPIIISVNNIGFSVHIPISYIPSLQTDTQLTVFTHTHVRDDAIELYGFKTQEELDLFLLLITVSGIGPKTGLLIMDRGVKMIQNAITTTDVDFFTTIPRLGKKNAQKIIIELKNKLGSMKELDLAESTTTETKNVYDALTVMGFSKIEIMEALKYIDEKDTTIEQRIKHALKYLHK